MSGGNWAEKRLERWVLRPYFVIMLGIAALRGFEHDWPTAAIVAISACLTGTVGVLLSHNRERSAAQISQGYVPAERATEELTDIESQRLARSTMRFATLTAITALAVALRFQLSWWLIVAGMVGVWFLTVIGAGFISAYRPAKRA